MKLFKKKNKTQETVKIYIKNSSDEMIEQCVTKPVSDYIKYLQDTIVNLNKYKQELDSIKPILTSKDYKPAISEDCKCCKYVVISRWDKAVLGCRKGNLCDDFEEDKVEK